MGQFSYNVTSADGVSWVATVVINYEISYDAKTNQSTITFGECSYRYSGRSGYGTIADTNIAISAGDNPTSKATAAFSIGYSPSQVTTPGGKTYTTTANVTSVVIQHSEGVGEKTVTFSANSTIKVYPWSSSTSQQTYKNSATKTEIAAVVEAPKGLGYIDTGSTIEKFSIVIDTGSELERFRAYIDNGTSIEPF